MTAERDAPVGQVPVARACELVSVSRSWYYDRRKRKPRDDTALQDEIEKIVVEFPGYGYRRVTRELHGRGRRANHKRVLRIMRDKSWLCRLQRRGRRTTPSNHGLPVYPNLLKNRAVTGLNQVWVADITYIRLPREFVYLAAILDAHSRKVVGWNLSRRLDVSLTLTALECALAKRRPGPGVIHHSDQGVQYAAGDYVAKAREAGMVLSMSRKGQPRDNAQAESFFRTLKVEQVYLSEYLDFQDAYKQLGHFIEDVYNRKRLHSALGYRHRRSSRQASHGQKTKRDTPVGRPSVSPSRSSQWLRSLHDRPMEAADQCRPRGHPGRETRGVPVRGGGASRTAVHEAKALAETRSIALSGKRGADQIRRPPFPGQCPLPVQQRLLGPRRTRRTRQGIASSAGLNGTNVPSLCTSPR